MSSMRKLKPCTYVRFCARVSQVSITASRLASACVSNGGRFWLHTIIVELLAMPVYGLTLETNRITCSDHAKACF